MNKQALAQALYDAMITDTRTDGAEFIRLADESPEWMRDVVRAAHCDMMPNDMRYKMISECAGALADCEDWEDGIGEIADGLVDIYNNDRLQWLASSLHRSEYCDEAQEEGLVSEECGIFQRIGMGQYQEYSEILYSLASSLADQADDEESAD